MMAQMTDQMKLPRSGGAKPELPRAQALAQPSRVRWRAD